MLLKIIQSKEIQSLFTCQYNTNKVVVNLLKGGEALKCHLTVNDVILGKYDLLSATSIQKAYKQFSLSFTQHKEKFKDQNEFVDLMLHVGQKIRDQEFEREQTIIQRQLTKEAKEFLSAPDLIDRMDNIERRTTKDPLIYCEEDLLLFNLVIVSCKTPKPITYEHTGPTSSGKTFPAEHAVNGFPKEMIFDPAGVSAKANKYDYDYQDPETGEFVNKTGEKCIYFREKEDSIEAVKFFKPMMSHDKDRLMYKVTGKNQSTGTMETITYVLDGIASFILLSVKHMEDEEMSSRTMKGSPTISREKTNLVITSTFESDAKRQLWKLPAELPVMHDAMFSLKKHEAINIFGPILGKIFPKDEMRRARDMNRLRGLIQACTVLHQYQRCYEIMEDQQVYYSSLEDNIISLLLLDKLLESTMLGIPATTMKIYELMKDLETRDIPLTLNNIHENSDAIGYHQTMDTLKDVHLDTLENHRLIKIKVKATRSKERSYAINQRFEDITKVPKLTPLFIEELQLCYKKIIEEQKEAFSVMKLPEVSLPKNTIQHKTNDEHIKDVIKHMFGFNYFDASTEGNVLWKICLKEMRDLMFSRHVLDQPAIDTTEEKEIIERKDKAINEIKTGQSAREWHREITPVDEALYQEYVQQQKEKRKILESGGDDDDKFSGS
ncbi:hypothetical protein [Sulfuricurvum sp.]|uniref:hypothetical protein n=1 Tax=Sulfuricurvum sp. TaxID=2025608 RepID=UPI003561731F